MRLWCPNRSKSLSRSSNTNSFACLNSTGFGDYTETGQVIPVRLNGEEGAYTHAMYLDDDAPIAGGRELWGFPKKLAKPKIEVESDVLVGTLHYGSVLCVSATMGYKHRAVDHDTVLKGMKAPNFILKIIPHVDGSARICELVRFQLQEITLKEAWTGPAALGLFPHALADVARLPVREVISALHFKADLTWARERRGCDRASSHMAKSDERSRLERVSYSHRPGAIVADLPHRRRILRGSRRAAIVVARLREVSLLIADEASRFGSAGRAFARSFFAGAASSFLAACGGAGGGCWAFVAASVLLSTGDRSSRCGRLRLLNRR